VTATDNVALTDTQEVTINVNNINEAPVDVETPNGNTPNNSSQSWVRCGNGEMVMSLHKQSDGSFIEKLITLEEASIQTNLPNEYAILDDSTMPSLDFLRNESGQDRYQQSSEASGTTDLSVNASDVFESENMVISNEVVEPANDNTKQQTSSVVANDNSIDATYISPIDIGPLPAFDEQLAYLQGGV